MIYKDILLIFIILITIGQINAITTIPIKIGQYYL